MHRLEESQLELLRYWRNNEHISQYMEYREHITEKMQTKWFNSINNINNFYFIIEYNDTPIGLINSSNINRVTGVADTGLFVWDDKYINSPVPVLASLGMLDAFFKIFGLRKVTAKVKNDNTKAINYNASLGFKLVSAYKNSDFSLYELHSAHYFEHAAILRKSAEKLYSNTTAVYLNKENEFSFQIHDIMNNVSEKDKQEINLFVHDY